MAKGYNWFSVIKIQLVECVITEHLGCCVCLRIWCMFICLCVPVMHYFCAVYEAALTVSSRDEENHYWQAVTANCEMEIKPLVITATTLSRTRRYTGERSKTAMITDKRANNISQLSLTSRLNSNCYESHARWTENRFECLQILLPLKLKALWSNGEKLLFEIAFFSSTNEPPQICSPACRIQLVVCRVKPPTAIKRACCNSL